ncbi:hypothetical protein Sango_0015600 [Sesamum angolense]|uniref:Uncharacterized protein n=1 Tax=Sesamum angolense TaxID=2727404 RepID=A0AAE1XDE8_9LAMI|nr:hypothetical protein Sango_0015600 [Sesamum angolense]
MFLMYSGGELILEDYNDASFQSNDDNVKSQSGFVFKLNGVVVGLKSSTQATTVDSTIEAEYIAAEEVHKQRNRDLITVPNTFLDATICLGRRDQEIQFRCGVDELEGFYVGASGEQNNQRGILKAWKLKSWILEGDAWSFDGHFSKALNTTLLKAIVGSIV